MAPPSPEETREMLSYVVKLSNILSECAPHALETAKLLYTTLFVRAAKAKNRLPQILNEFEQKWKQSPLSLYEIIPHLIDFYADSKNPDWRFARNHIVSFYDTCNKKKNHSITYCQNIKIPERFRPLPSLYYSVQNDIQYFKQSHGERKRAYRELQAEFQAFGSQNPDLQCPVNRKYAILQSIAPPETVWEVKKDAFAEIFQRTRELFLFHEEEAHFHHAARILDYWQSAIERRNKPDTRKDEGAFEKQAREMKTLQRVYIDVLERMQRSLKMDEVVKFVSGKMDLSRDFMSVRNTVAKHFDKMKYLLDDHVCVLPALVKQEASLASSLYSALHERQKLHDKLKRTTEKVKNLLLQVQGWETLTGNKLFSEPPALGQPSNQALVNQSQVSQPQLTQPLATQEQYSQPHVAASPAQAINDDGIHQPQLSQPHASNLQFSEIQGGVPQYIESQVIEPQIGDLAFTEQEVQGQHDELLQALQQQVNHPTLNEPQVSEPQVGQDRVGNPQSNEHQMPAPQVSLPQERELVVGRAQASQPELEVYPVQALGEDQGDQPQIIPQQVGIRSEQAPGENQISQQQHGASPGEMPDGDQDSGVGIDRSELGELSSWGSLEDAVGGVTPFEQEALDQLEAALDSE